jgi:5S rRNA maturation endonuclease (ribonuclease M5)
MAATWVDFGALKQSVGIERVLEHYGVQLKQVHRGYLRGRCPLPGHSSVHSMESFVVNARKNIWACHSDSCRQARNGKVGGNILDLVACMESCAIREAALRIQDWLYIGNDRQLVSKGMRADGRAQREMPKLPFSLRLNSWHPYLDQRGISRQTAQSLGVGYYAGRGILRGRIVFPIHNERGEVVAYAGRRLDGAGPKYRFPAGFSKSRTLFHLPDAVRFAPPAGSVILVEGFFDCMKVHQAGFGNVVALMGTNLSEHQAQLLAERFQRLVLMLDGDEAGQRAGSGIAARLSGRLSVKVVTLPARMQPDQMSSCEIQHLLQPVMGSFLTDAHRRD